MKKVITVACILSLFIGCSAGSVQVKKNPFSQSVEITYDRWHKVLEGALDNRRVLYEREIVNGKRGPVKVTMEFAPGFSFDPTSGFMRLDGTVQIATDGKSFKLPIQSLDVLKEVMPGADGKTIDTGRYFNQKAHLVFTPEVEKAILNCKSYMILVTAGGQKTVMQASSSELSNLKKFLTAEAK
jgi:hypothetical protein